MVRDAHAWPKVVAPHRGHRASQVQWRLRDEAARLRRGQARAERADDELVQDGSELDDSGLTLPAALEEAADGGGGGDGELEAGAEVGGIVGHAGCRPHIGPGGRDGAADAQEVGEPAREEGAEDGAEEIGPFEGEWGEAFEGGEEGKERRGLEDWVGGVGRGERGVSESGEESAVEYGT